MHRLKKAMLVFVFSVLFLFLLLPLGWLVQGLFDPLRLRKGQRVNSYLRLAAPRSCRSGPPPAGEPDGGLARKS